MFRPVNNRIRFPQMEEEVLRFWREREIFRKSQEAPARVPISPELGTSRDRGAPRYAFYEGPPTANASPGIHHVLSRAFKDVVLRYWHMRGYQVSRKGGWDTHGLPVELEVEKELGLISKTQIEEYGVAAFNARCREGVMRYVRDWEALTERIAFWLDLDDAYVTFTNDYIESCWWILKQLWDKGLLYQDYKVTPHCPRCGTSLSDHEVALGYKDDTDDPSVYVKMRLLPGAKGLPPELSQDNTPTYFLVWTTTPWTLPANVALAIAPEAEYALVEQRHNGQRERLILAQPLVKEALRGEYATVTSITGADLKGIRYEGLFPYGERDVQSLVPLDAQDFRIAGPPQRGQDAYRVVAGDFVSLTEGTGIVHIAPAYGEVDLQVGRANGLPLVHTVGLDGRVLSEWDLPGQGLFVKEADSLVLEDLKARGLLYRSERIRHTYPFCWRCDTPLLYYAKTSWYIKTTARKERLISGNQEIHWYPAHIRDGRFGEWLANNVDWALSRERYWGTPLPLWRCEVCGAHECIGSVRELEALSGRDLKNLDLHRPYVDEVTFPCTKGCGGTMKRVPEVIDCWFDSGAMPVAQWHYPFENQDPANPNFPPDFPADFICEAVDQTRGWFYSLHAIATLLFDQPCYRHVICLGHILDAKGEKMSKSKGNVVEPWGVINEHGVDAIRWYLYSATPAGNARRFSANLVGEALRKFLLTLWNTYSFFVLYANIDGYNPRVARLWREPSLLDRWILSELHRTVQEVTREMDAYDPTAAARRLQTLVDLLSNWYVRRSRRRFWKATDDADKRAAYDTLYQCLTTAAKLLAPFTPFVAEELYQNLVRSVEAAAPESVHMAAWPQTNDAAIDEKLMRDMELALRLVALGRSARAKAGVKVRQPLAEALVKLKNQAEAQRLRPLESQIREELNVRRLVFTPGIEGGRPGLSLAEEAGYVVGLALELTPELRAEGLAREIAHRIQGMRRAAGFEVTDRILTTYQAPPEVVTTLQHHAAYIQQETLSLSLQEGPPPEGAYVETHRIDGHAVTLSVHRLT